MKLSEAIRILRDAGIENPRYDARTIFEQVGGIKKSQLILTDAESSSPELLSAIERRKGREPLQYILGEMDFYRETYEVSPACLIPRQDTEILVDFAVKNLPSGCRFIDICTGSGCVAVSILKNTKETRALAVDISSEALAVAKRNAERNSVSDRVRFICEDALSNAAEGKFFAVISNPPYVCDSDYENLEPEIYFEPRIAFVGGVSGLDFYGRIVELYKDKLENSGFFAFEIGFNQGNALKNLAKAHNMSCEIIKDYSDNDRVAVLKRS